MTEPIRVVSLFCGIGGADHGLYLASEALGIPVEVVDAIDSWEPAVRVYNANQPHPVARAADAKNLNPADLPPHDLIIGGPPCQSFSNAGKRTGHDDPRNAIPDFVRLTDNGATPFVMENVKSRLLDPYFPGYWSEQLCAADFGDVTLRKRWFYSNMVLHVQRTPGVRRFKHIRDAVSDREAKPLSRGYLDAGKRGFSPRAVGDDGFLGSMGAGAWHQVNSGPSLVCKPNGELRCVSVLEMQLAHSLPIAWDFCGYGKTHQGKMIANAWPAYMARAVCGAILQALSSSSGIAA